MVSSDKPFWGIRRRVTYKQLKNCTWEKKCFKNSFIRVFNLSCFQFSVNSSLWLHPNTCHPVINLSFCVYTLHDLRKGSVLQQIPLGCCTMLQDIISNRTVFFVLQIFPLPWLSGALYLIKPRKICFYLYFYMLSEQHHV